LGGAGVAEFAQADQADVGTPEADAAARQVLPHGGARQRAHHLRRIGRQQQTNRVAPTTSTMKDGHRVMRKPTRNPVNPVGKTVD